MGTHSYDAENRVTKAVRELEQITSTTATEAGPRILNGSQTWGGQGDVVRSRLRRGAGGGCTYQVTAPLATAPAEGVWLSGRKLLVVWDGTQAGDDQLKWLVTDHLGSARMEANKSGSLARIRGTITAL
ncbi:MAG: hypothetical protein IPO77_15865 [Acidobacteria bacterium]|nr:hypothetical protein [Acidobacteriota bacterium]